MESKAEYSALSSTRSQTVISSPYRSEGVYLKSEIHEIQSLSITSIACKMLEHIYCSHLHRHIDTNNILGEVNHGFRAKHSTETQLLVTSHDLLKHIDQGKQVDVLILDFSKTPPSPGQA